MDSILGKVIAAILALIAVALVAVAFFVSYENDRTSNLVAAVGSTELNIRGDYIHSASGYASVTNASVISAGEAPGTIVKNGQLVSPWGASITITPIDATATPVTSGYAPNFQIDVGPLPGDVCAKASLAIKDLMALNVAGTEYAPPADPAAAATMCAGNPDVVFQFGQVSMQGVQGTHSGSGGSSATPGGLSVSVSGPATYTYSANSVATGNANSTFFFNPSSVSPATVTISNATGSPQATITSVSPAAADFSNISDTCTGATLSPGTSCTIQVGFYGDPSGSASDPISINTGFSTTLTATVDGVGNSYVSNQTCGYAISQQFYWLDVDAYSGWISYVKSEAASGLPGYDSPQSAVSGYSSWVNGAPGQAFVQQSGYNSVTATFGTPAFNSSTGYYNVSASYTECSNSGCTTSGATERVEAAVYCPTGYTSSTVTSSQYSGITQTQGYAPGVCVLNTNCVPTQSSNPPDTSNLYYCSKNGPCQWQYAVAP
jgi:hypothetical protein